MFDKFWADPRIPPEMKRCGKPPVRKALAKVSVDYETILQSIEQYADNKEDWRAFCHLSVFINQERFDVDHAATSDSPFRHMTYDERREWSQRHIAENKLRIVEND